ncbi:ParB N-terminal domain-containing protein [uncultured Mitsuokella sp.]|uniref:ParB/RepB/Spo0J family partition protein n=1 Tax=uncultured Mitsuokella sp. TaxID=453120 RepID=UPI00258C71C7|nr:ParB N-terminal domain-containing protein [uncultured Mitsuokella sp.]
MFDITSLMSDASRQASERPKYEAMRLPISKLYPDPANTKIYAVESIEELADSIELAGGVMHNLVVREADKDGRYQIISGERRWTACKHLVEQGKEQYGEVGCIIEHVHDEDMLQLMLVLANSTARQLTDAEKMRQAEALTAVLTRMRKEGKVQGRVRELVGKMLKTTSGQLARYHAIQANLQGGLRDRFERGEVGVSVAYEASKLDKAGQDAVAEKAETQPVTLKDVTAVKMQQGESEAYKAKMERLKKHREQEQTRITSDTMLDGDVIAAGQSSITQHAVGGKTLATIDEHEPVGHKSEPEAVPPAIGPDHHDIGLKTQMGALRYVQRELDRMHVGMLVRKTPEGEEEELGTVRVAINREVDELLDIIQVKLECCHASMVNAMRGDK